MQQTAVEQRQIACRGLPLAVYREVAAHLRQVEGVNAGVIPQRSPQFNYHQSQVSGLWIEYAADLSEKSQQRLEAILDYYAQRHGSWH